MDIISLTLYLLGGFIIIYILVNLLLPDTELRKGIYAVPGGRWYTIKWLVMYCVLKIRHRKKKKKNRDEVCKPEGKAFDVSGRGYGTNSHEEDLDMEFVSGLGNDPHDNNSVYINGINPHKGTWIDVRIAKRQNGVREVWFLIRLPEIGDLVLPQHPLTVIHDVHSSTFEGAGLKIEVVEPLKTWNIIYEGDCRIGIREKWDQKDDRKSVYVSCSLQWTASTRMVNFDTDLNISLMAENIAKEKWSGTLFNNMKRLHQTHYEQFGELNGNINVTGHPARTVCASGVRDRSFGPRNWDDFYSYCLLFATFEDGTSLHVGAFCIQNLFSNLHSGFMINKNGLKVGMVSSTLSLPDLIQDNTPPTDFSFTIKMENGMKYSISVHTETTMILFPDDIFHVKIHESKAKFTMNETPGCGISEWLTRNAGD